MNVKLDFDDVLIVPQFSDITSRSQVETSRTLEGRWGASITGAPIIAANMDGVGTFSMHHALKSFGVFTAITKHHTWGDWMAQDDVSHAFITIGMNEDELEIVKNTIPDLEKLWSKINWIWESANPTGIYKSAWQHMSNRGTFKYSEYKDENGEDKKRIEGFELHNKNEYNVIVGDHLALLHLERGFTLKENLDKISEYSVKLRNLFGMTIIWLQQFNDGLSSIERIKFKGVDISPQQTDFKDSRNPYTDADVVLGIMNAYKLDMESCLGYNINIKGAKYNLLERFRLLKIIKNRLSRDGMSLGLLFIPEAGNFEELPYPGDINQEFIDRINKLNK